MAIRKRCAFCGSSDAKITNEHAWPNWIRALLPATPSTIIGTRAPQKPIRYVPRLDDMGVKVNAICKPCNEGWLSDLESEVRPFLSAMIGGTAVSLNRQQQASLTRWTVKTSMVFEFTGDRAPFYSFNQRNQLRSGIVPAATVIWAARYEGTKFLSTAVAKSLIYDVAMDGETTRQPGHALTLSVGQFVVQTLSVRPRAGMAGVWLPVPRPFRAHTIGLWPPSAEQWIWPPGVALTDAEIVAFMERLKPSASVNR